MKKIILISFLVLSNNLFAQTVESFFSGCEHSLSCKKCPPEYKETYQINVSKQVVLYTGVDLKTNKVDSQVLENCSVVDGKNFICGEKNSSYRSDGALLIKDGRTVMRNGIIEGHPYLTIMDKNGKMFSPPTPKKICRFKKNFFGQYESTN
jgi:hypothetical protein